MRTDRGRLQDALETPIVAVIVRARLSASTVANPAREAVNNARHASAAPCPDSSPSAGAGMPRWPACAKTSCETLGPAPATPWSADQITRRPTSEVWVAVVIKAEPDPTPIGVAATFRSWFPLNPCMRSSPQTNAKTARIRSGVRHFGGRALLRRIPRDGTGTRKLFVPLRPEEDIRHSLRFLCLSRQHKGTGGLIAWSSGETRGTFKIRRFADDFSGGGVRHARAEHLDRDGTARRGTSQRGRRPAPPRGARPGRATDLEEDSVPPARSPLSDFSPDGGPQCHRSQNLLRPRPDCREGTSQRC